MSTFTHVAPYLRWANPRALESLNTIPHGNESERAAASKLLAHVVGAELIWSARILGKSPTNEVFPEWSEAEISEKISESVLAFERIPESLLQSTVRYQNSKGEEFSNVVEDLITHLMCHGAYHRGQIAAIVKRSGGTPVNTDFIMYLRK